MTPDSPAAKCFVGRCCDEMMFRNQVVQTWSILGLTIILATSGCAASRPQSVDPIYISSWDLWTEPDKYDGERVAVTGLLQKRDYLFFKDVVTTNNIEPVIYVRPSYGNADPEIATADCVNQVVRVYGRFRKWSEYESLISDVYLIVRIKHRMPGPEDEICWSNSNVEKSLEINSLRIRPMKRIAADLIHRPCICIFGDPAPAGLL